MSTPKDSIDKFFDAVDDFVEPGIKALKGMHYPGKEEDEIPDAEFREVCSIVLGAVELSDKKGHYWHVFDSVRLTDTKMAVIALCELRVTTRIVATKKLDTGEKGFIAVCLPCLFALIKRAAFETQSDSDKAVKELTDGK